MLTWTEFPAIQSSLLMWASRACHLPLSAVHIDSIGIGNLIEDTVKHLASNR